MSVGEVLKKAREEKNLTLKEIYNKTKISEKFLEKIESGIFDFAPEPYVKAFLRSYARVVGLNPDEVIKLYDSEVSALKPKETMKEEEKRKIQFDFASFVSENVLWLIGGALLVLLAIFIFIGVGREERKEIRKKGFETAVEEILKDDKITTMEKRSVEMGPDSLELKILASDSVWLSVLVDSVQAREFLMPPNTSLTLKAKNNFSFTIGNAGGVKFILNGNELEAVGRKGVVVRNYVIDREKLKSLTSHR